MTEPPGKRPSAPITGDLVVFDAPRGGDQRGVFDVGVPVHTGLSKARKKGAKVPPKKKSSK